MGWVHWRGDAEEGKGAHRFLSPDGRRHRLYALEDAGGGARGINGADGVLDNGSEGHGLLSDEGEEGEEEGGEFGIRTMYIFLNKGTRSEPGVGKMQVRSL